MVQDVSTLKSLSTAMQILQSQQLVFQLTKTPGSKRPAPFKYKLHNFLKAVSVSCSLKRSYEPLSIQGNIFLWFVEVVGVSESLTESHCHVLLPSSHAHIVS